MIDPGAPDRTWVEQSDAWVLRVVAGALYEAAAKHAVSIHRLDTSQATPGQTYFPGRNFLLSLDGPKGFRHWTVWIDPRNRLLNEDALRREAESHIEALIGPRV